MASQALKFLTVLQVLEKKRSLIAMALLVLQSVTALQALETMRSKVAATLRQ